VSGEPVVDRFGKLIGIIMEETLTQINKDLPSVGESSVVPVSRLNDLLQIKGQGLTILEIQRKLWSPPIVFYFRKKVTMAIRICEQCGRDLWSGLLKAFPME
jgi:hypothetical protein